MSYFEINHRIRFITRSEFIFLLLGVIWKILLFKYKITIMQNGFKWDLSFQFNIFFILIKNWSEHIFRTDHQNFTYRKLTVFFLYLYFIIYQQKKNICRLKLAIFSINMCVIHYHKSTFYYQLKYQVLLKHFLLPSSA